MLKTLKNCIFFSSFSPYGVHMIRLRKAINDLVIVLILIAIAVPILFLIQTWLSTQVSKLPSAPQATASYSVTYSGGNTIITIKVTNQYTDKNLQLVSIRITYLQSGPPNVQVISGATGSPFSFPAGFSGLQPGGTITPKSDGYIVLAASGSYSVNDVSLTLRDTTTQATFEIKATGGTAV
jgi:hypothetical protein